MFGRAGAQVVSHEVVWLTVAHLLWHSYPVTSPVADKAIDRPYSATSHRLEQIRRGLRPFRCC